jgi:chromosome segregation ATPase
MEIREMKDQIRELVGLLRQSEIKRKEVEKELKVREQDLATTLAKQASVRSCLHKIQKKINQEFENKITVMSSKSNNLDLSKKKKRTDELVK